MVARRQPLLKATTPALVKGQAVEVYHVNDGGTRVSGRVVASDRGWVIVRMENNTRMVFNNRPKDYKFLRGTGTNSGWRVTPSISKIEAEAIAAVKEFTKFKTEVPTASESLIHAVYAVASLAPLDIIRRLSDETLERIAKDLGIA